LWNYPDHQTWLAGKFLIQKEGLSLGNDCGCGWGISSFCWSKKQFGLTQRAKKTMRQPGSNVTKKMAKKLMNQPSTRACPKDSSQIELLPYDI
jgi:hypothetical protein